MVVIAFDYDISSTNFMVFWCIQMILVTILAALFIRQNFFIKENKQKISAKGYYLLTEFIYTGASP